MVRFNVPPTVQREVMKIDRFRGVDLTNSPTQISISRSSDSVNMIRDTVGNIRKRTGYETMKNFLFPGRIRGIYMYKGKTILQVERELYSTEGELLAANMPITLDAQSEFAGFEMGAKLYIKVTGPNPTNWHYLVYDGETVQRVQEVAYIPHVFAGKGIGGGRPDDRVDNPRGGEFIEPFNLVRHKWVETFSGIMPHWGIGGNYPQDAAFLRLSRPITRATVEILESNGMWRTLVEAPEGPRWELNDFYLGQHRGGLNESVVFNRRFNRPEDLMEGEDWIRVTAEYVPVFGQQSENTLSFLRCGTIGFSGVNGARNVVLFAGDSENANKFFYSKEENPTYIPDTNFNIVGEQSSAIMGFSMIDGRLAVHKDGREDAAIYLCRGEFKDEGEGLIKTFFRIVGSVSGGGTVSRRCFELLNNDPMFLTKRGVFALTVRDILGGTIVQSRSYFVDGALQKYSEEELEAAHACIYRDFYMLCVPSSGRVYVLDGLQKAFDENKPQSSFQYECYVLDNVKADFMWVQDEDLYFARNDDVGGSAVYRFFSDSDNANSYNDCGEAIEAYWDLPEIYGQLFYRKKTFLYLAVQLGASIATGVELWVQLRGLWRKIGENFRRGRYFSWGNITWSRWTWNSDQTTRSLTQKFRIKKADKARYRLMNRNLDESFAIYSVALEFKENGKIRR